MRYGRGQAVDEIGSRARAPDGVVQRKVEERGRGAQPSKHDALEPLVLGRGEEAAVALVDAQMDAAKMQVVDALGPCRGARGDFDDQGRDGGLRAQQVGAEVVRA